MSRLVLPALFLLALPSLLPAQTAPAPVALTPEATVAVMDRVNTWQMANLVPRRQWWDWTYGAYLTGWKALADISPDAKHYDGLTNFCGRLSWALGPRVYHADDHCVGQTYSELFQIERDAAMIAPLTERFEFILATPPANPDDLDFKKPKAGDKWSWCDALFMAPTVWVRLYGVTGDRRYLDFGVKEWWKTYDYLYDKEEHLFFRDSNFFTKQEANGRKVFWSRGNGWVVAGLARVLQYLPADHPDRPRFITLFRDMCTKLAAVQGEDGLWRASLLDPASFPVSETSGSGFFTYALMWGVNQGILERKTFEPAALKGWKGLLSHVHADGMLGNVQPIGYDPRAVKESDTEVYGTGAFLLAGSEVYRHLLLKSAPHAAVTVSNSVDLPRFREVVSVKLASLPPALRQAKVEQLGVMSGVAARWVDVQPWDNDRDGKPDTLLFQADFPGKGNATFEVFVKPAGLATPAPVPRAFARFVPERMDDMAWENDRVAHRMYGPALMKGEGTVSSGIDVWLKSTRRLVVDYFYKTGDYHKDHGQGLDCYGVGQSRGCGGLGILSGGKVWVSNNYAKWKVLAAGPIRASFELTYEPWDVNGTKVSEVKRITLDAGSHFNRIESTFTAPAKGPLQVAVGLVDGDWPGRGKHPSSAYVLAKEDVTDAAKARVTTGQWPLWFAAFQNNKDPNGDTAVAIVVPDATKKAEGVRLEAHWAIVASALPGKPFVHYAGSGWSKGGVPTAEAWSAQVAAFAKQLDAPLTVTLPKSK